MIIPVILCGGSGTRLQPLSGDDKPKQFLRLTGGLSLLQETLRRAMQIGDVSGDQVVTVTLEKFKKDVLIHLAAIEPSATRHVLYEPLARNTAAAVAFAALHIQKYFGEDSILWILPSDHYIGNPEALKKSYAHALTMAEKNHLVTFGIPPTRPETGYGYIRLGKALMTDLIFQADAFVEKPDEETAQLYMDSGDYLWNSGMFLFQAGTILDEFRTHAPHILEAVDKALLAPDLYAQVPNKAFDRAIMEKSNRVVTVPCDPGWSDIGSWESLRNVTRQLEKKQPEKR